LIDNVSDWPSIVREIPASNCTIICADQNVPPSLVSEIVRTWSGHVLTSGWFLAAYTNTAINYSRISIRTENLCSPLHRIENVDIKGIEKDLSQNTKS
jgi:hypothetical protein